MGGRSPQTQCLAVLNLPDISPVSKETRPPMTTMVKACEKLSACAVTSTAIAGVTEGAGPEMTVREPPNTAAKKPTAIEP